MTDYDKYLAVLESSGCVHDLLADGDPFWSELMTVNTCAKGVIVGDVFFGFDSDGSFVGTYQDGTGIWVGRLPCLSGTPYRRIQRRRVRGWKMPPHTVYVGRGSKWGNPFIVGKHGNAERCVTLYARVMAGYLCLSVDHACVERQKALMAYALKNIGKLRGKNLACWCRANQPCHADILLQMANRP